MKNLRRIIITSLLIAPGIAAAQLDGISTIIARIGEIVQQLTIIVAGIAVLVFFWGLVKFISKAGDETAHEEGKRLMIWGILALFIMVSIWGIIYFIANEIDPEISPGSQAPDIINLIPGAI